MTLNTNSAVDQRNRNLLLMVTMLANFFNPFTGAAVNIALPEMAGELSLNAVQMSWVTMAYLLSSAVMLLPMGKIADRWGRKRIFITGNVVFMLGSFLCAFSFSALSLIASRVFQGIGAAMMVSTSMALIMSAFPPHQRGKVIGINVASVYLGLSAAPVLGGFLTQAFGWHSLFVINGTVAVVVAIAMLFVKSNDWKQSDNHGFDWSGIVLYVVSLSVMMYGFSKMPETSAIALSVAGLLGLTVFIRIESGLKSPLLDVKLFRENLTFSFSNLSAFINYAATFAVSFVLSLYLQYARHLSPREAGMVLMMQPVLMAIVSLFSGRLSDKLNARWMASIGMTVSVIGLFMLAFLQLNTSNAYILTALGILGLGFGIFSSPNTNVVMSSVEHRYFGVASATLATMRNLGMMFSMAVASLAVHVFIGNKNLNDETMLSFLSASKVIFLLFTAMSVLGIFTSLKNSTRKLQS